MVVVALAFVHEPRLGNGKNGEGDKDKGERNLHGWKRSVVAVCVGVKPAEVAVLLHLYTLTVSEQNFGVASITGVRCHRCHLSYGVVARIQIGLGTSPIVRVAAEIFSTITTVVWTTWFEKYGDEIGWERWPGSAANSSVSVGMEFN
jgi:hypothetical protein